MSDIIDMQTSDERARRPQGLGLGQLCAAS